MLPPWLSGCSRRRITTFTIDFSTNFCGPYWSDGKFQSSVRKSTLPSLSEFDETCRIHDVTLANAHTEEELRSADLRFYNSNIGKGLKRSAAAILVKHINPLIMSKNKKSGNLRGSQPRNTKSGNASAMANQRGGGNDTVRYAPVAVATKRTSAAPSVQTRNGVTTIAHRAYLAPITNTLAYTVGAFAVNPGLSQTFPWLHRVARRYEEYRFKKLRFEFRSVAATSTAGVVMLSFDYDAADAAPTSKQSQAQTVPSVECNAWAGIDLSVPVGSIPWKYVRAGILGSNLDVKTYDAGQLFISTIYGPGSVAGELYVEYEVELRKPTEGPVGGCQLGFLPPSITSPFSVPNPLTTIGVSPLRVRTNTSLEFISSGEWLIYFWYTGSGITANTSTPVLAGQGSIRTLSASTSSFDTGSAYRSMVVRSFVGDVLTVTTLNSGAPVAYILTVSLIDFESAV